MTHFDIIMNASPLYIVGSAGSARECANYALDAGFQLGGFVVPDAEQQQVLQVVIRSVAYPTLAESEFLGRITENDPPCVLLPLGFPDVLRKVSEKYLGKCQFPNLIHPTALLADDSIVCGQGNIIGPNCVLTTHVTLGDFNYLNLGVSVAHDVVMGSYNVFYPKVSVSGAVHIGDANVFGTNSALIQGITIGNHNKIGMASAVIKDMSDDTSVLGVPARQFM